MKKCASAHLWFFSLIISSLLLHFISFTLYLYKFVFIFFDLLLFSFLSLTKRDYFSFSPFISANVLCLSSLVFSNNLKHTKEEGRLNQTFGKQEQRMVHGSMPGVLAGISMGRQDSCAILWQIFEIKSTIIFKIQVSYLKKILTHFYIFFPLFFSRCFSSLCLEKYA